MKDISPIVVGVLLVAFTVAIATIIGGWFGTFTRETTSKVNNQTDISLACATANIEIDTVYLTPRSTATVRVPVRNTGFINLQILSAQLYDWCGNNFTAANIPMTDFEKGVIKTLIFSPPSSGAGVDDSTNYNHDGTLGNGTSGTTPTWASGKYHSSLSFDGIDDIIHINSSKYLRFTNQLTAEAWFYARNITAQRDTTILRKDGVFYIAFRGQNGLYGANNKNGHQLVCGLFINSTRTFGNFPYLSSTEINASSSLVTLNKWHHVACTFKGTHAILYLDGTAINTSSYTGHFQSSLCIDQYEASKSNANSTWAGDSSVAASLKSDSFVD